LFDLNPGLTPRAIFLSPLRGLFADIIPIRAYIHPYDAASHALDSFGDAASGLECPHDREGSMKVALINA